MQEKEMLHDLVLESKEHLQSVEPDLLELEQLGSAVSDELINRVFRAVHSIKGGFGFFGLEHVTRLSHTMENILSRVRDHGLSITSPVIDALFQGIDKMRVLIDDIENSDSISIEKELEQLYPFRSNVEQESGSGKNAGNELQELDENIRTIHPNLTNKLLEDSIRNGKVVYIVTLHSHNDMILKNLDPGTLIDKWEKFGTVLDVAIDFNSINGLKGSSDANMIYSVVFASVLESDLIGTGCEVPDKQILQLDLTEIRKKIAKSKPPKQEVFKEISRDNKSQTHNEVKSVDDTLRVKVNLLNNLMNLAGELVLGRNQLVQQCSRKISDSLESNRSFSDFDQALKSSFKSIHESIKSNPASFQNVMNIELERLKNVYKNSLSISLKDIPGINTSLQSIDTVTSLLQENIMQTRLQPVSVVFNKFPRVVRDLARKLEKQIELRMQGQDVELDKSIVELLSDPLTHLIRNSCDHGIEHPQTRLDSKKNPVGTIVLRAYQEGGKVIIEIEDDGKGIDSERIKEVALKRNLITDQEALTLSEHELQMLILKPGFSTADKVSDVSGRGVGMDVVKSNIEKLGGSVSIESDFGKNSKIRLTLPLTLAIIPSLIVSAEGRNFAVPQVSVEELLRIRSFDITKKIERIQGAEVTRIRGKLLPLVRLAEVLNLQPTFVHPTTGERLPDRRVRWSDRRGLPNIADDGSSDNQEKDERRIGINDRRNDNTNAVKIVIVKTNQNLYGLVVEMVYDSEEIVVKPLPGYLKTIHCYAGATIMGDGKVAMILDPGGIGIKSGLRFADLDNESKIERDKAQKKATALHEILLFDNNTTEKFALNLNSITRIEHVNANEVERIGNREFVKRDGHSVALIRIHDFLPVASPSQESEEFFLILPRSVDNRIGIIAGNVYDILQKEFNLDTHDIKGMGILGSTIIDKKLVIMLNIEELINEASRRFEVTYG